MSDSLDAALARLDDYVRRRAPDAEEAAYEEDLFARALAGEAPELAVRDAIGSTLRRMKDVGSIQLWMTRRQADALAAANPRVLRFELDLANPRPPALTDDFDLLVTRVPLPLGGVRQLDVEVLSPAGEVLKVMPDVEFDPADGAVFACCEAELARVSTGARSVSRVWATDDRGRRLLATIPLGL
jgi:hypothetical protein